MYPTHCRCIRKSRRVGTQKETEGCTIRDGDLGDAAGCGGVACRAKGSGCSGGASLKEVEKSRYRRQGDNRTDKRRAFASISLTQTLGLLVGKIVQTEFDDKCTVA